MYKLSVDLNEYLQLYERINQVVSDIPRDQLQWKKNETVWSITEVLTHLLDHAFVVNFRLREVLSGSSVQLPAFNQDEWVKGQYANEGNITELLETYRSVLQYNGQLLRRLKNDDWHKSGINPKNQEVTVEEIIQSFISHVYHHIKQIKRIADDFNISVQIERGNHV